MRAIHCFNNQHLWFQALCSRVGFVSMPEDPNTTTLFNDGNGSLSDAC